MAAIAWSLPDDRLERSSPVRSLRATWEAGVIDWRVTTLALTCFLYAFGYGGVTSFVALFADASDVHPRGLFFGVFSVSIAVTRPFVGRLSDQLGYRRVFLPCLGLTALGYALLAIADNRAGFALAAAVFAAGFGSAYPAFAAFVMSRVDPMRRAAAYGSIIAAFDTGIGTGSIALGLIVERLGFAVAYGVAAGVALLAIPYLVFWAEPRFLSGAAPPAAP